SSGTRFVTIASTVAANTTGNVYLNNTGSVTIGTSSAGSGKTFDVLTIVDAGGNGAITVGGNIKSAAGTIGTINLNSTETTGTGGITEAAGILTATNLNLTDGAAGAGTADLGASGARILSASANLTA